MDKLLKSLAVVQSKLVQPKKNKHVKFNRVDFWYADLESCVETVRHLLVENGLCFTQLIIDGGIKTILYHTSGSSINSFIALPDSTKADPKHFGALLTYYKRYSFCSLLGIVADDDKDAPEMIKQKEKTNDDWI
jgi:hypothetical protein